MRFRSLPLVLALTLAPAAVWSQSYQSEVGAQLSFADVDNGGSDTSIGLRAEYHFVPVQTRSHPLAEASFLEQSTRLFAQTEQDFDYLTVGGELYIPDTMFYVAGALVRTDNGDSDTEAVATLGLTPIDGLRLSTSFTDHGYDLNLHAKYVTALVGGNYVHLEAEVAERDGDDYFNLGGDFYFNRYWSVGAAYTDNYGDEFTLRSRRFFSNELSGEVAFTDTDWGYRMQLGAALRF